MDVIRWDPADASTAAALHEVFKAAQLADDPIEPSMSLGVFRSFLTGEWEGAQGEVWYVPDGRDGASGYYRLGLPDAENLDRSSALLFVHPSARRRGLGTALVRHAAARAAANDRAVLDSVTLEDSPGDAFAANLGAKLSWEKARLVQNLGKVSAERIASLRADAESKAAGYELVTWTGTIPDERTADMAGMLNAYADSPRGEGVEPEAWDADRVRQRTGKVLRETAVRSYSVAAVHGATGEMAAFTEVTIDPEHPEWGRQRLTAVTRPHRGHRLGLLVKTAMLQWLGQAEPRLERIATGNAASNSHMIAVNEALGLEVVHPWYRFYELLVDKVI
jgi:GNAT superfamily N-acetyltransferase